MSKHKAWSRLTSKEQEEIIEAFILPADSLRHYRWAKKDDGDWEGIPK